MKLEELVGKKVVRTEPAAYEDDSYTRDEYITVVEATEESITYIQHFGHPEHQGTRKFNFNSNYDQGFLDDNWIEFKEN